ncbi:MAG: nuclear transport factor 2 family protein [Pyrinomonadaceae bacterium]
MKAVGATAILAVLTYPFVFGQTVQATNDNAERDAVVKVMNEAAEAYAGRDPKPFETIFLTNYVGIRDKPEFDMRQQLIAMVRADAEVLKAGKRLDFQTLKYENTQVDVRLYGITAIVIASKKNHWRYGDRKCLTSIQATELWIKREGEWRAAASHATNFHCESKPYHPTHPALVGMPEPSRPVNSDHDSELQIRGLINSLVRSRAGGATSFSAKAEQAVTADFVSTAPDGSVSASRDTLFEMPAVPARATLSRNSDDAIVIFDASAIYTFRLLETSGPGGETLLKRGTVFLVRSEGGWKIAAMHMSSH